MLGLTLLKASSYSLDAVEFKMKLISESGAAGGAADGVAVLSGPPVGIGDALMESELAAT
jgi:hypothetical protein